MKLFLSAFILAFSFSANSAEVDMKNSVFTWKGTKVTGSHHGKIYLKSATLKEDKGQIVGAELVMDLNSITNEDIDSPEYRNKLLNHLKNEDFFEIQKFPTAKLVVKEVAQDTLKGDLTIKDKTQPIMVNYKKEGSTYSGVMKFDRTKFGLIYGSGDFFKNLGDKMIHNEVSLEFKVQVK